MRLSATLSIYIGRHFLSGFAILFLAFLLLVLTFDIVELMRRAAAKPDVTFGSIVQLALLKLPYMGQQTFPFAILFGGMAVFWRLTRSNELVVTRGAGVSAWQFLFPVLLLAFLLGIAKVTIFNPLSSALLARYERQEATLLKGQSSLLEISKTGLWLRQSSDKGPSVIRADRAIHKGRDIELSNVAVFMYSNNDRFSGRIDAVSAKLEDGFWSLKKAWIHEPEKSPKFKTLHLLPTDLTMSSIQDSFAPPETMSFWALPNFIETLENSGFSAVRHRLHWHSLLAAPFLMCAMVLLAATFTLRHTRRGGTTYIIAGGVMTGFLLYFFSDVVFALGLSDSIPVTLAAWTPSGVAMLLGLAMLLHLEDG
ncbi:MAG: LPS export ABC transporter permease LptG [Rhodospirillales bacterium]